jgi:hypothetical protein
MKTIRKALPFVVFLLAAVLAFRDIRQQQRQMPSVHAQGSFPDCSFTFTFTGNVNSPVQTNASTGTPCVAWRVTYSTTGTLTSVIAFQTSPDNVTFTSVPNTICSASVQPPCVSEGANPTASGRTGNVAVRAYDQYIRVNVSGSSGAGTGTCTVYGYKGTSAGLSGSGAAGGAGATGATGPSGPAGAAGATGATGPSGPGGGGSGLLPWNPAASTPPTLSSWTQINTGGNGVFADVTGGVLVDSVSGNNIKGLYVATPGASGSAFTITGHVNGTCPTTDTEYGLLIGDSSANYISWSCKNGNAGTGLGTCYNHVLHTNNTGVPQSAPFLGNPIFTPDPGWLRMKYDGTNISFQVSATGANTQSWLELFTEAAASGLAANPSRIGIFSYPSAGSGHCINTLGYWLVTQP